jgi:hypothetical protein
MGLEHTISEPSNTNQHKKDKNQPSKCKERAQPGTQHTWQREQGKMLPSSGRDSRQQEGCWGRIWLEAGGSGATVPKAWWLVWF